MSFDPQLDAQLRDVPLPAGMIERLKASLAPTDAELDDRLRQVELPAGLLSQLRGIPHDELVDQQLCEVPVPFELVWRARRESWTQSMLRATRLAADLALALVLFLAIGGSMTAATSAFLASIYPHASPPAELAFDVIVNRPVQLDGVYDSGPIELAVWQPEEVADQAVASPRTLESVRDALSIESPEIRSGPSGGPVSEWFTAAHSGIDPMDNIVLLRWGILGFPQFDFEVTPALESPVFPAAAGIELPAVRGYDRGFVLRRGVFPPARPAAHPALAALALPLGADSTSHQNVVWLARDGQWPAPSQVRTESFLAAMEYRFPPANPGELAIRTAGGPSVFGPPGAGLVQIAAVAGALPRGEQESHHLVVALDASSSMARGHRLELAREAIGRLLARLDPRDRLSLVVFQEEVKYQVERATSREGDSIRQFLAELRPAGGTDLAEGLQQAVAAALAADHSADHPPRIVLVTDSQVSMPPETLALVTDMLASAGQAGVCLDIMDLGDRADVDETLAGWAEALHGDVRRPQTIDQASRLLTESLAGRSPVVASEARLSVRLNPQAVAAYRLIGHEPNAMAGLRPPALSAELRADEAATTLLEIWFQPNDENDVGQVELVWRDPSSGQEHQRTQRISRIQFAPTWEQAPITLQQAAIAAQTAEVLRGARTALRELGQTPQTRENVASLLEMAARVHPRLAERPDFQEWVALLEQLAKTAR